MDAYEFSFVAVPAQREAGVLKGLGSRKVSLKELAEEYGAQEEYRGLFKLAQLGRQYVRAMEDDVVRLCLALELGVEEKVIRSAAQKVAPEELVKFKNALQRQMEGRYPVQMQLPGGKEDASFDSEYMI